MRTAQRPPQDSEPSSRGLDAARPDFPPGGHLRSSVCRKVRSHPTSTDALSAMRHFLLRSTAAPGAEQRQDLWCHACSGLSPGSRARLQVLGKQSHRPPGGASLRVPRGDPRTAGPADPSWAWEDPQRSREALSLAPRGKRPAVACRLLWSSTGSRTPAGCPGRGAAARPASCPVPVPILSPSPSCPCPRPHPVPVPVPIPILTRNCRLSSQVTCWCLSCCARGCPLGPGEAERPPTPSPATWTLAPASPSALPPSRRSGPCAVCSLQPPARCPRANTSAEPRPAAPPSDVKAPSLLTSCLVL